MLADWGYFFVFIRLLSKNIQQSCHHALNSKRVAACSMFLLEDGQNILKHAHTFTLTLHLTQEFSRTTAVSSCLTSTGLGS